MSLQTNPLRRPLNAAPSAAAVLPLENGDRLTVAEFRRRYEAMPQVKRADLINGVVYIPLAVNDEFHGAPHIVMATWLGLYMISTPGTRAGDNSSLRELDPDSEPQADARLRIMPAHGGQTRTVDGYVEGAPELVTEIASSGVNIDLHDKFDLYERAGVRENVIWRTRDQAVDWFVLRDGCYVPLTATSEGRYESEVFPGLWLDAAALLAGDLGRVLQVVQEGIASPGHAAFVQRLANFTPGARG